MFLPVERHFILASVTKSLPISEWWIFTNELRSETGNYLKITEAVVEKELTKFNSNIRICVIILHFWFCPPWLWAMASNQRVWLLQLKQWHTQQYWSSRSIIQKQSCCCPERENQFESSSDWSNRDVWTSCEWVWRCVTVTFLDYRWDKKKKKVISTMWQIPVVSWLEISVTGECCRLCCVWTQIWEKLCEFLWVCWPFFQFVSRALHYIDWHW